MILRSRTFPRGRFTSPFIPHTEVPPIRCVCVISQGKKEQKQRTGRKKARTIQSSNGNRKDSFAFAFSYVFVYFICYWLRKRWSGQPKSTAAPGGRFSPPLKGGTSWGLARDFWGSAGRPGDHLFSRYFLDKILISFWRPFGCQWLQKWTQKPSKIPPKINKNPMRKSMPKKSWKLMKNRCENGLEIDGKSV